jgi:drug/metabolite transporter (DMT)-like permease
VRDRHPVSTERAPVFSFMRFSFSRLDALLLGMTLIWGSNFSLIKAALRQMPELGFNALRMALGSLLFAAVIQHRHGIRLVISRFDRRDWIDLVTLGVIGHFVYQLLFMAGVARTSVANSSLVFGCTPVTVALLSSSLGHERITPVRWAGVALSLGGIYLVVGQANQRGASLFGDLLILGAMFCWAGYTVGSRSLLTRHSPLVVTGFTMTIGSALYAPLGVPSLLRLDWALVSWWAWVLLAYSAVFALVVAYVIWYTAVQRVGNSRTSIYSNVVPLVAMSVAAVVLGEPITPPKIAGAVAILAGVALTRLELQGAAAADTPSEA